VVEIQFDGEDVAESCSSILGRLAGVDAVESDGSLLSVTTELPMGIIIKELNGHVDHINSIGRTEPRLRDVLREMLRVSGKDLPQ
jgi:hypothetical protein